MTITPYQIVVPLLCAFVIAYAWHLVYRQKKTIWEGVLWTIFWGCVAYVSIFPNQVGFLSEITGIRRHENAIIVTAIGIQFFLMFYLVIRLEEVEYRVTKILREEALKDVPKEQPQSNSR